MLREVTHGFGDNPASKQVMAWERVEIGLRETPRL
jgi:hypothetical protein